MAEVRVPEHAPALISSNRLKIETVKTEEYQKKWPAGTCLESGHACIIPGSSLGAIMAYFTEREFGESPRTVQEMTSSVWRGITVAVKTRITNGYFGLAYPEQCPDAEGVTGTDASLMRDAVTSLFPIEWPLNSEIAPDGFIAFDLVEFCYERVAKASPSSFHRFFGHHHLVFDEEVGRVEFRNEINQILSRNGSAFALDESGIIVRLAPIVLRDPLAAIVFNTGDTTLDELLETARHKFLSRDNRARRESLEKIWDAWERLKTISPGEDKKASVNKLLRDAIQQEEFRSLAADEAQALTNIGNKFMIRHSEAGKIPVSDSKHVDYLFHRMFALIRLLLLSTGRGG
jgi:hypothetical protein